VGSTYGRFYVKFPQSRMKGQMSIDNAGKSTFQNKSKYLDKSHKISIKHLMKATER
jgi:hypothetical protein